MAVLQVDDIAGGAAESKWTLGVNIALLTCLSCPAYAAVFLMIGALFPHRSMAHRRGLHADFRIYHQLHTGDDQHVTVQYRVRRCSIEWVHVPIGDRKDFGAMVLAGNSPAWLHVTLLIAYTIFLIIASIVIIRNSEFSSADESASAFRLAPSTQVG